MLFVVDAKEGIHPLDFEVAEILRRSNKEVILVINKMDVKTASFNVWEFTRLGFEKVYKVSAEHGKGIGELLDEITKDIKEEKELNGDRINVIIVGRPNVGKSTLLNALVKEERVIVDNTPGTTRDPVKVEKDKEGVKFSLIDTPGVKKKSKIKDIVEFLSSKRLEKRVMEADVAVVVIDAQEGLTHLEKTITGWLLEEGKGVIVVVNKCDLLKKREVPEIVQYVKASLHFARNIPVVPISALKEEGLEKIENEVVDVARERKKKISAKTLEEVFENIISSHPPPRGAIIKRIVQVGIAPPSFIMLSPKPERIEHSYLRYIKNRLYDYFGFKGVDIRITVKRKIK